jgi:hypothetical protein
MALVDAWWTNFSADRLFRGCFSGFSEEVIVELRCCLPSKFDARPGVEFGRHND